MNHDFPHRLQRRIQQHAQPRITRRTVLQALALGLLMLIGM